MILALLLANAAPEAQDGMPVELLVSLVSFVLGPSVLFILAWIKERPKAAGRRQTEMSLVVKQELLPVREDLRELSRRVERVETQLMNRR
ncbi:hypothetical protein [Phycicoccus flavus]|uniref:hypothetical protein n=1 Tax=Phycicoccus flavus TaxID=2502783 RepID=UPI000FEB8D7E|nr:hypothetical protein [Phycicoccus flavus]NHA69081.1 hypothetical protein [Phycicoccus flavus]